MSCLRSTGNETGAQIGSGKTLVVDYKEYNHETEWTLGNFTKNSKQQYQQTTTKLQSFTQKGMATFKHVFLHNLCYSSTNLAAAHLFYSPILSDSYTNSVTPRRMKRSVFTCVSSTHTHSQFENLIENIKNRIWWSSWIRKKTIYADFIGTNDDLWTFERNLMSDTFFVVLFHFDFGTTEKTAKFRIIHFGYGIFKGKNLFSFLFRHKFVGTVRKWSKSHKSIALFFSLV